MNVHSYTYYYFVGAGGIGMSALERYFHSLGKEVLGYDKTQTALTSRLIEEGVEIHFEDWGTELPKKLQPQNTLVVYTPAVKQLGELDFFRKNKFTVLKRAEVLGEITKSTDCLAVAGTHGKTTTSSILGHILKVAQLPSTAFLGGIVENYQSNIILGGNEISVVEADEFDRSFLKLSPDLACITSTDADHLDIYGDKDEMEKSFVEFSKLVKGKVFARLGLNIPDAVTYAVEEKADYYADNIQLKGDFFTFDLTTPHQKITEISMHLPGRHNIENAVAAIAMAMERGVAEKEVKWALDSFKGVKRRFTRHKTQDGKVIIDDYAHHPTELKAIIKAVKNFYPHQKMLCVFQPHLYSRTQDFAAEFSEVLADVSALILLEIYPARETPISGVNSDMLADKIEKINGIRPVVCSLDDAENEILKRDFDVLLLTGAGNIDTLFDPIKEKLN